MIESFAGWIALLSEPEARMLGLQAAGFAGVVAMFIASLTAAALSARSVSQARRLVKQAEESVTASNRVALDLQSRLDALTRESAEKPQREIRIGAAVDTPQAEVLLEPATDTPHLQASSGEAAPSLEAETPTSKTAARDLLGPPRGAIWRRR